jgi:hypothetical protein
MMDRNDIPHGFKVPDSYFSDLEDRLVTKLEEEALPESSGFKVPDGYFDELEERLATQLFPKQRNPKIINLINRKRIYYVAGVAASVMLLVSIFNNPGSGSLDSINLTAIEMYIEEGSADIDPYDVATLLTDEEFDNLLLESSLVSEESLESYLLENLDDTTLLTE